VNDRQVAARLYPSMAIHAAHGSPGKYGAAFQWAPALAHQTNRTLVAPSPRDRVTVCCHAAMYWAGVFPLTPFPHGYQVPFISCMSRT
jgi:hypothetical protein